jgi:hypothetical protein
MRLVRGQERLSSTKNGTGLAASDHDEQPQATMATISTKGHNATAPYLPQTFVRANRLGAYSQKQTKGVQKSM